MCHCLERARNRVRSGPSRNPILRNGMRRRKFFVMICDRPPTLHSRSSDRRSQCRRLNGRFGERPTLSGRFGEKFPVTAHGRLHSVTTGRFGGSKLLHQVINIHAPDTHHHRQQHPARASAPSCSKPASHHFRRYQLSRCNFATRISRSATRFTSRRRETISSRTAERLWSGMPCRSSSIAISP